MRADECEAAALRADEAPVFVLDRQYGVSGDQPAEVLPNPGAGTRVGDVHAACEAGDGRRASSSPAVWDWEIFSRTRTIPWPPGDVHFCTTICRARR